MQKRRSEIIDKYQKEIIKMTLERLQEILIEEEETLSEIRHKFYIYKQYNIQFFDNLDEKYEKELESIFKKSWNKCDKIIKKKDPFREKTPSPKKSTQTNQTDLWSYLKRQVYQDGWQAKNLEQLKKKITKCIRDIDLKVVQRLAESTIRF